MNTPADKPDLPVTDWYAAWSGNCLYGVYDNESEAEDEARRIGTNGRHSGLYTADTVGRLLADERRKVLEEAEARLRQRLDAAKHSYAISQGPYSEGMRDAYDVAVLDIQSLIDRKEPT